MNWHVTQTNEAERLPLGWRRVKLGETCEINPSRPKHFSRAADAITTFIPMEAVDERLGKISAPEIRQYSKISKGYTYFEERDVLFSKITPCMQNGKHAIAKNLINGIGFGTTEFHVLRPNSEVLPEWIYFFIRQPYFLQEAATHFIGAVGQQRVPESFLANYVIPLPPLPEQKLIVSKVEELMEEVEHAHTACGAQLEAARALPSTYLRYVLESDEAKKWERKKLREILDVLESGGRPTGGSFEIKEGVPSIGAEHLDAFGRFDFENIQFIPKGFYHSMRRGKLANGDVLIVKDGATTGKVSFVGCDFPYRDAAINEHVFRLRAKSYMNQEFLFWVLYSPLGQWQIQQEFHGSTQGGINQKFTERVYVPTPPLPIQERVVPEINTRMLEVKKLKTAIEKQLDAIKALPQAILRKAFSGEL